MSVTERGQPLLSVGAPYNLQWFFKAKDEQRTFDVAYTVNHASTVGPDVVLPAAELLATGVVPEARGAGLGGALIRGLQDAWLAAGVTSARVVVSTGSAAPKIV